MSEQCPFCVEARTEAAKRVYKWLVTTKGPIPRDRANYLQAYVRLGHRIDLAEGHTPAGWILEKMLENHETWGLDKTDGLDTVVPIEYPGDIQALLTMIEKKAEKK